MIPGTKSTIADMEFMRSQGWDIDVLAHVRHGGRVLGICGGYQMLGRSIDDPEGVSYNRVLGIDRPLLVDPRPPGQSQLPAGVVQINRGNNNVNVNSGN